MSDTPKPPRKRHFYVFPWHGAVDLHNVSAVGVDHGRVNAQLYGGGFSRSEPHPQAAEIVDEMLCVLETFEGVTVTRFDQGGECERTHSLKTTSAFPPFKLGPNPDLK